MGDRLPGESLFGFPTRLTRLNVLPRRLLIIRLPFIGMLIDPQ